LRRNQSQGHIAERKTDKQRKGEELMPEKREMSGEREGLWRRNLEKKRKEGGENTPFLLNPPHPASGR
jgi:hypothetical protein